MAAPPADGVPPFRLCRLFFISEKDAESAAVGQIWRMTRQSVSWMNRRSAGSLHPVLHSCRAEIRRQWGHYILGSRLFTMVGLPAFGSRDRRNAGKGGAWARRNHHASFPLTPTLSLRDRGNRLHAAGQPRVRGQSPRRMRGSLSLRERAGVRGKEALSTPRSRLRPIVPPFLQLPEFDADLAVRAVRGGSVGPQVFSCDLNGYDQAA
jgi:hypothetical protein